MVTLQGLKAHLQGALHDGDAERLYSLAGECPSAAVFLVECGRAWPKYEAGGRCHAHAEQAAAYLYSEEERAPAEPDPVAVELEALGPPPEDPEADG
ncbi:MAG: hypothetical protein VW405_23645 [Rhodospirillaceae bacterium]